MKPASGLRPGTLYLVPTPIGNLEDITLRALRVLREADWVAAEDTRRAKILFQAHEIRRPLFSHHAHNEHRETPRLVARLRAGETGALITDAGTPAISDPGYLLAREARESGIPVIVLPGPSAVITALVASGLPPVPFVFLGYVPPTSGRRRKALEDVRNQPLTAVLFEVPHRLRRTLEAAAEILPDRTVAVLREMTKLHEEAKTGRPQELLDGLPEPVRGEIVLVFEPLSRHHRAAETAAEDEGPGATP